MKMHAGKAGKTKRSRLRHVCMRAVLALVMVLGMFAPMAAFVPQTAFAGGTANPNGTRLDLLVQADEEGSIYKENPTFNKSTATPLSLEFTVTDKEDYEGQRTIEFDKPLGTTGNMEGTNAQYIDSAGIVGLSDPNTTHVVIPLVGTYNKSFNLFVNLQLSTSSTPPQAWTLEPELKIDSTHIVESNASTMSIDTKTQVEPLIHAPSPARLNAEQTIELHERSIRIGQEIFGTHAGPGGVWNGVDVESGYVTYYLPAEATLVPGSYTETPGVFEVGVDNGRTTVKVYNVAYASTIIDTNTFGSLKVTYSTPPADNSTYQWEAEGYFEFKDGSTYTAPRQDAGGQVYDGSTPPPPQAGIDLQEKAWIDTFGNTRDRGNNSLEWVLGLPDQMTSRSCWLSVGDVLNFGFNLGTTGSYDLSNAEVTLPLNGDIWDYSALRLQMNKYVGTPEAMGSITISYKDHAPYTISFSDASVFDQTALTGELGSLNPLREISLRDDWYMPPDGLGEHDYVTQAKLNIPSMILNARIIMGIKGELRETHRSDGSAVQEGELAIANTFALGGTATAAVTDDPTSKVSSTSSWYTKHEARVTARGTEQAEAVQTRLSSFDFPSYIESGQTYQADAQFFLERPYSYNGALREPSIAIAVVQGLAIDPSSFEFYIGDDEAQEKVDSSKIEYLSMYSQDGWDVYRFVYKGTMHYREDYYARATYDVFAARSLVSNNSSQQFLYLYSQHSKDYPEGYLPEFFVPAANDFFNVDGIDNTNQNMPAQQSRAITLRRQKVVSAYMSANGSQDGTFYREDRSSILQLRDSNLGRVIPGGIGKLRLTLSNITSSPVPRQSITGFMIPPTGAFVPEFQGIEASLITVGEDSSSSAPAPSNFYTIYYTTDPAADAFTGIWTAYDPGDVAAAAGATAFKIVSEPLEGNTELAVDFKYLIPNDAPNKATVRGYGYSNITQDEGDDSQTKLNYAGFRSVSAQVTVNYYKGSIDAANKYATSTLDSTFGSYVNLSPGTDENQLSYRLPNGYKNPYQANPYYVVRDTVEENVVNVIAEPRTDLSYTINYYKGSVEAENKLTFSKVNNVTAGTKVSLTSAQLNAAKALAGAGYLDGEQQGTVPYVVDDYNGVINVVYPKKTAQSVTVHYKLGSVLSPDIDTSTISDSYEGASITLETGTSVNQLNYKKPISGYQDGVQQSAPYTVVDGTNDIYVVYLPKTNLAYTVNYYKDSVSAGNLISGGTWTSTADKTFASAITVGAGTNAGELDWKLPAAGYKSGTIAVGSSTTIGDPSSGNVVNVVYEKKDNLTYTVNYYTDSVAPENLISGGTWTSPANQVFDANITVGAGTDAGQLDWKKPATGYATGAVDPSSVSKIGDPSSGNIVNVVYTKKNSLTYTVNYYKDSVSAGNLISGGTWTSGSRTFGDSITVGAGTNAGDLDWKLPAAGYESGTVASGSSTTIGDPSTGNVVNVVYTKKTNLSYTVNYYTDSVSAGNLISGGTWTSPTNQTFDATITISGGTNAGQLDWKKPASGYVTGVVDSSSVSKVGDPSSGNVINVVYVKNNALTYTVNYYKDSVSAGNLISGGTWTSGSKTFGAPITVGAGTSAGELDWKLPAAGYKSGAVASGSSATVADPSSANVVNVVYEKKDNLTYTVNYYTDSVSAGNLISGGTWTSPANQVFDANITVGTGTNAGQLDWKKPATGYVSGTIDPSSVSKIGDPSSGNIVNVVYVKNSALTYTVNYYKDSVSAGNLISGGTWTSPAKTFGAPITVGAGTSAGELDWKLPAAGYKTGTIASGSSTTVGDPSSGNIVNVVYEKKDDLTYTVNYYTDSVASENLISGGTWTSTANKTFASAITVGAGTNAGELDWKLPAAGYKSGSVASGSSTTIGDPSSTNVVNVVYEKKDNLTYTVNYYTDSVSAFNLISGGTWTSAANQTFDATISIAAGTNAGELDYKRPSAGYQAGVVDPSSVSKIGDPSSGNIVNVVYAKKNDLTYTVNYYTDSVAAGNLISGGTWTSGSQTFDTTITVAAGTNAGDLDYKKPALGYESGTVAAGSTARIGDPSSGNVVNVVYAKKANLAYTVNYYLGSVSAENLISDGTWTSAADKTFGAAITVGAGINGGELDWKLPAAGYKSGTIASGSPTIIGDPSSGNIVNVVYEKKDDLTYTVNYYTDSVAAGNLISGGTWTSGSQTFDTTITVAAGTNAGDLDWKLPATGYQSGRVDTSSPTRVGDPSSDNIVNVIYDKKSDLTYTVKYYRERTQADEAGMTLFAFDPSDSKNIYLGESSEVTDRTFQELIVLGGGTGNALLDQFKPARGYLSGVQQDGDYEIIDGTNTIHVLYARKQLPVTVNYYKDDYKPGSLQGSASLTHYFGDLVVLPAGESAGQLDYKRPARWYGSGKQELSPCLVEDNETPNTINVLYAPTNTKPVVEVKRHEVYLGKGVDLTKIQVLQQFGTTAWDKEDGTYPLSRIKVEGWNKVDFNKVNYPNNPYTLRLTVTDSGGLTSDVQEISLFIVDNYDPGKVIPTPKDYPEPPAGYHYVTDEDGNIALVLDEDTSGYDDSANVTTGDSRATGVLMALLALGSLGVLVATGRRGKNRREDSC